MKLESEKIEDILAVRPVGVVDEQNNVEIISVLNSVLANEYVLFTKTLNFHWNFTGPRFTSMHQFLEDQYNGLLETMDNIAERVKILDGLPLSTAKEMVDHTIIPERPGVAVSSNDMIATLIMDNHVIQKQIKEAVTRDGLFDKDPGTEDFLVSILQKHEKTIWMLKSNLG